MSNLAAHVRRAMDLSLPTAGRHASFGEAMRLCRPQAIQLAEAYLRDVQLAQDAVQEASLVAWLRLDQLRNAESFAAWFRRAVQTQCDLIARQRRAPHVPLEQVADVPSPEPNALEVIEREFHRDAVRRAVDRLPLRERDVIRSFYYLGESTTGIARRLNIHPATTRTRLHAARRRMRLPLGPVFGIEKKDIPAQSLIAFRAWLAIPITRLGSRCERWCRRPAANANRLGRTTSWTISG